MANPHPDQKRIEAVRAYVAEHPTAGRGRISAALNIPPAVVQRIMLRIGHRAQLAPWSATPVELPAPEGTRENKEEGTIERVDHNPCTVEDLLKACRVDLKRWKVSKSVVNKWEVGTRLDNGKVLRTPLYQVKAWLDPLPGAADADVIKDTIEWIRSQTVVRRVPVVAPARRLAVEDPTLLELSVPDIHYGKLAWHAETGKDYDKAIAASLYMEATRQLWARSAVFPVTRILLVVGNDYFNVNGAANATAAGTPQSEDGRWALTFRRGIALLREQIEFLRGKAPEGVDVRVIRGNHDAERMYMAGEVLAAMYANCDDVHITNEPIKRQYVQWGSVLLGLTHGDKLKLDKLPLLMAGEAPAMWAATTHREWHLGHFHHKKETQYHTGQEHNAVRVRVLPSLTTADEWHYENGYVGAKQAAEAYLWGKKAGYIGHLSWGP